jgi:hypothetical protein
LTNGNTPNNGRGMSCRHYSGHVENCPLRRAEVVTPYGNAAVLCGLRVHLVGFPFYTKSAFSLPRFTRTNPPPKRGVCVFLRVLWCCRWLAGGTYLKDLHGYEGEAEGLQLVNRDVQRSRFRVSYRKCSGERVRIRPGEGVGINLSVV